MNTTLTILKISNQGVTAVIVALCSICILSSCTPILTKDQKIPHKETPVVGEYFSPEQYLPNFDDSLKQKEGRLETEMGVFVGWTTDDEALEKKIRQSIKTKGFFHDPEELSPNFLYRVTSLTEAEQKFGGSFLETKRFHTEVYKKWAKKTNKISVAYFEPDSIALFFFNKNNQLIHWSYAQ